MDGDFAPIKKLSDLALKYKALFIVDEAHAVGLYGPGGKGLSSSLKEQENMIAVYPCGKALSASGAFIAGPKILKPYLINKCRTFIYTTASLSPFAFSNKMHIEFVKKRTPKKRAVKKESAVFSQPVKKRYALLTTKHFLYKNLSLVPLCLLERITLNMPYTCKVCYKKKAMILEPFVFPTVPKGKERLRICIHYNHTYTQLKKTGPPSKNLLLRGLRPLLTDLLHH